MITTIGVLPASSGWGRAMLPGKATDGGSVGGSSLWHQSHLAPRLPSVPRGTRLLQSHRRRQQQALQAASAARAPPADVGQPAPGRGSALWHAAVGSAALHEPQGPAGASPRSWKHHVDALEVFYLLVTFCLSFFFKILFIYLFMIERERERKRSRDTEGEAGSMQGGPTWDSNPGPRVTTWAGGRCSTDGARRSPQGRLP